MPVQEISHKHPPLWVILITPVLILISIPISYYLFTDHGKTTSERDVFIETGGLYGPWPSPKKHNVFAVRANNKKLIYNDTPETWEFYNLKEDPSETKNLYDNSLDDVQLLKTKLMKFFEENNIETKLESNS